MGHATAQARRFSGSVKPYKTLYSYDLTGKVTQLVYPGGFVIRYAYHPGTNLIRSVTGADGKEYANITEYSSAGRPVDIQYGNSTATRYSYDGNSLRLQAIVTADPSRQEANDLQRKGYDYSKAGDIVRVQDALKGVAYNYTYDLLHRFTGEAGNRDKLTSSAGYSYDDDGNILTGMVGQTDLSYLYDDWYHARRLMAVKVNGGTTQTYQYDERGQVTEGPDRCR